MKVNWHSGVGKEAVVAEDQHKTVQNARIFAPFGMISKWKGNMVFGGSAWQRVKTIWHLFWSSCLM